MCGKEVTYDFSGKIAIDGGLAATPIGSPFTGTLTYDTNLPDLDPDPRDGAYVDVPHPGSYALTFTIGDYTFATNPTKKFCLYVHDYAGVGGTPDYFTGSSYAASGDHQVMLPDGWNVSGGIWGPDYTGDLLFTVWGWGAAGGPDLLHDDALPTNLDFSKAYSGYVIFDVYGFSWAPATVDFPGGSVTSADRIQLRGTFDTFALSGAGGGVVPEPSTFVIFSALLGMGLIGQWRRRRKFSRR